MFDSEGKEIMKVTAGCDWMRIPQNASVLSVDARVTSEDSLGANLDFQYHGKCAVSDRMTALFKGESDGTDWGEGYYFTQPRISSRSHEYAWVNDTVFIGMGKLRLDQSGELEVSYRIFKLGNPT